MITRLLLLTALLALPGTSYAQSARLQADVTVDAEFVRLGDIIENAGNAADQPIFRAPELGATGTIQVSRVLAAAREQGITSIDTGGFTTVVVRRSGRLVTADEIRTAVKDALVEKQSLPADTNVLYDAGLRAFVVEKRARASATISDLSFDARSGRFEASIIVPGSAIAERLAIRVSGSVGDMASVPVLARSLNRGDIIQAADIAYERKKRSEFASDTLFDQDRIIGMAMRRPTKPGQMLRDGDLVKPELVERGATVTVLYELPGITLTMRGKAMSSGSDGDVVSIQNLSTKKVLEGRVSGPSKVTVSGSPGRLTTAIAAPLQ